MKRSEIKNNDSLALKGRGSQSGRSMIEMLGVLAIIGVLSVGGIAGYSKAMQKHRINKTIEQITLIAGNVRSFFAPQGNYDGVNCGSFSDGGVDAGGCPIIKKAKILPDEMITLDSTGKITSIINPFGGRFRLESTGKAKDSDKQAFWILYDIGDNMEACIELVTYDWTNAGVRAIYTDGPGNTMYLKTPVDIAIAPDFCTKAQNNASYGATTFVFDIDLNSSFWSSIPWSN